MIDSIRLRNFQLHRDFTLGLSPTVTTIVGSSDCGKSAVLRAIRWTTFNRPSGDAFIREGANTATVEISVDGHEIVRKKGKKNLYLLDGNEWTAFGNDVPKDIADLLNLEDINFQNQHDGPFWLQDTAGAVSRQLNKIVNLDVIDKTLSCLASALSKARAEKSVVEKRLGDAKNRRSKLKFVRRMDEDLRCVETQQGVWKAAATKAAEMNTHCVSAHSHKEAAEKASCAHAAIMAVYDAGMVWQDAATNRKSLEDLTVRIRDEDKIARRPIPDLRPLESLSREWKGWCDKRLELAKCVEDIKQRMHDVAKVKTDSKKAEATFKERMGDTCPLCDRPMK